VLAGLQKASRGSVEPRRRVAERVAFVPQRAEMLLFRDRVRDEVRSDAWLERLGLMDVADRHPWTLSAGQRLWTALATAFTRDVDVLLLDEPTRGLDPVGKDLLSSVLREKADAGVAVLLVTHDVELVARAADRIHMLAEGEIVASGPVREVLGESLLFSSQTSKVMGDARFLVPSDVTG
jgi:energy-coupling factor transport system ATP-binding protein